MAYVTVHDLRSEGVSEDYSTEYLTERIALASAVVERLTRCYFEVRQNQTIRMDGSGHECLELSVPPVDTDAITSITVGGVAVDSTLWEVVMPRIPDGRFFPKIRHLISYWPKGRSNIIVTGTFGFVDSDGGDPPTYTTPLMIKDLVNRLVVWHLPKIADADSQAKGRIIKESLKDYSYELDTTARQGEFGDDKIDNLIARFRKTAMGAL